MSNRTYNNSTFSPTNTQKYFVESFFYYFCQSQCKHLVSVWHSVQPKSAQHPCILWRSGTALHTSARKMPKTRLNAYHSENGITIIVIYIMRINSCFVLCVGPHTRSHVCLTARVWSQRWKIIGVNRRIFRVRPTTTWQRRRWRQQRRQQQRMTADNTGFAQLRFRFFVAAAKICSQIGCVEIHRTFIYIICLSVLPFCLPFISIW